MITTIHKWGNSSAIRLPSEILYNLNLLVGNKVEIIENKKSGIISIIPKKKDDLSIREMSNRINKKNKHINTDWGNAVGNEIW